MALAHELFVLPMCPHELDEVDLAPQPGATTFGLCTRKVALLRCTQDRKPNVFLRSIHRSEDGCRSAVAPSWHRTKRKALSQFAKCLTSLVAGARYAQRCPVELGVAMEVVIAA